jgi:Spy/CpxP family protein refolding chaperone
MVNAFQKEMKTIHKKKKKLREDIHEMLEEDKLNDNKVEGLIDNFFNNESEIQELRRKHHKEIDEVLTAEQTIKYLIFDHKFKKRIKDQLLKGRKHRGDGPPH